MFYNDFSMYVNTGKNISFNELKGGCWRGLANWWEFGRRDERCLSSEATVRHYFNCLILHYNVFIGQQSLICLFWFKLYLPNNERFEESDMFGYVPHIKKKILNFIFVMSENRVTFSYVAVISPEVSCTMFRHSFASFSTGKRWNFMQYEITHK